MDMAAAFGEIAYGMSELLGGPFVPARIIIPDDLEFDDGGSVIPGEDPRSRACRAQVDSVTEAMRAEPGFTEQDQRILVIAASFCGEIKTDYHIEICAGPYAGAWSIESVNRDPVAAYHELRGRRA